MSCSTFFKNSFKDFTELNAPTASKKEAVGAMTRKSKLNLVPTDIDKLNSTYITCSYYAISTVTIGISKAIGFCTATR